MSVSIPSACVCGLLAAASVFAQAAFPLEHLQVTGNNQFPTEKIVAASGLKIGAKVTKSDFDDARARLMATGAFENVGYAFKASADNAGYDAVVELVEVEQRYPYRFEDLPVADDVLRAELRKITPMLGDEIPVTNQILDEYIAAIQAQIGSKVKVSASLNSDLGGRTMILFGPNKPRELVSEVKFTGNQILPSDVLIHALAEQAMGTAYSEVSMRAFLDSSIRPLYDARGRFRVSFPKIETKPSMFADGALVVVTIDEGPSYSLGDVKLTGMNDADAAEMRKVAQSKDLANFAEVKAGLDRVIAKYRNAGYLRASAKTSRDVDDANQKVNLSLAIDPGPQFMMGKLEIAGLDGSSEPEVRKRWTLKAGAPFNPDYPDGFLKEIAALFENLGDTRSEKTVDEKTHAVDVKLYFVPTPTDPKRRK
jgi:outer membrane protein assembly factor BamA